MTVIGHKVQNKSDSELPVAWPVRLRPDSAVYLVYLQLLSNFHVTHVIEQCIYTFLIMGDLGSVN